MDIKGGNPWPASALSNFAPHPFILDDVECASMEGFLQSLKFKNPDMQREVCKLVGRAAKLRGKKKKWQRDQTLYWRGQAIDRHSQVYQNLLDIAFEELSKNTKFRKALLATNNATLTHSIGRNNEAETVLTTREFIGRLTKIRSRIQSENI